MKDWADVHAAGGSALKAGDAAEVFSEKKLTNSPDWLGEAIKDEKGKPLANVANALLGLRSDPKFRNAFVYDEMLRATLFKGRPFATSM